MGIKSAAALLLARYTKKKQDREARDGVQLQHRTLNYLLAKASVTAFGREHGFSELRSHVDFISAVPVRDYEHFIPFIERIKQGEPDILWPGKPLYLCKTSGTTSGTKYIPLTRDSMPNHIGSARNALLSYIAETGNAAFTEGKMIFLQGSPKLDYLPSGIPYGRLSGIVANHVPGYLQKNRMPSYETNCIEDWETKVHRIAEETIPQRMSLISGIPSWVQMYFEIVLEKTGKSTIAEVFPEFSLFPFGGVNFEPYRNRFRELIGRDIPTIELYPASEGFIAFQDSQNAEGLLLNCNSGIFFEFIPADDYFKPDRRRLSLGEVEIGVNYALLITNNAGLWSYSIGDTVRFVSLDPPRIKVTGRIKHFTSAFGEHVIAEEVERAMSAAISAFNLTVREFHVAPQVTPVEGLPYHEWFLETDHPGMNLDEVRLYLDERMKEQNIYYRDLIVGNVLRPLVITLVKPGTFAAYMQSVGRLGGQNKVQRLANDRSVASFLEQYRIT